MIKQDVTVTQSRVTLDIHDRVTIKKYRGWKDKATDIKAFTKKIASIPRSIDMFTNIYLITQVQSEKHSCTYYGYYETGAEPILFDYFGALTDHYMSHKSIQMKPITTEE